MTDLISIGRSRVDDEGVSAFDVTKAISSLVDRSVVQQSDGFDGRTRYGLLETMRAYGRYHLQLSGVLDQVRERHARHIHREIVHLHDRMVGPDEAQIARRRLELIADALVALDWFIDLGAWDAALQVCRVGSLCSERAMWEMIERLHHSIVAADADEQLLRAVEPADLKSARLQPQATIYERSWGYLRSGVRFGHSSSAPMPSQGRRTSSTSACSSSRPDVRA